MNPITLTIIIILASLLTIVSMLYMSSVCFSIREECIDKCKACEVNVNGSLSTPINISLPNLNAVDNHGAVTP